MKVTIAVDISKISKQDYVNELRSSGQGDIARSISVVDNTTPETIQIDVDTEEEFNQILSSNKVAGAQTDRLELIGRISGSRSITANITSTVDISHHNWGLVASTQNSTTLATSYTYNNLGANVDCVIMDTGIVLNHPEFNNQANTSTRINQINWGGSQGVNFYTDPDGHGTHCAGIMAGRTQGWASDADIYSFTTNLSGLTH
jgi:subtilisin family serine protease